MSEVFGEAVFLFKSGKRLKLPTTRAHAEEHIGGMRGDRAAVKMEMSDGSFVVVRYDDVSAITFTPGGA